MSEAFTPDAPLITKYRPSCFEEVVGHEEVLTALRRAIASSTRPHAYLLTGPAGLGKTTLARIIAKEFDAEVNEADAASNSGVDAMRTLVELGQYAAFSESSNRMFLIDECHRLSRNAWDALLKILEEPPAHLYFALCTTDFARVPETIYTRCYHVNLRPLRNNEMFDLLGVVADLEGWKVKEDVLQAVIQAATGQPRKGLTILQSVHDLDSRAEVKRVVTLIDAGDPIINLLQHLAAGKSSWKQIQAFLARMEGDDYDELLIQAGRYIAMTLAQTEEEGRAQRLWQLLEALVFPAETYDKKVAFIAALGRMLWGGG